MFSFSTKLSALCAGALLVMGAAMSQMAVAQNEVPEIYGSLYQTNGDYSAGIYKLGQEPTLEAEGPYANCAGLYDGGTFYFAIQASISPWGDFNGAKSTIYKLSDAGWEMGPDMDLELNQVPTAAALHTEDYQAYGCYYNNDMYSYVFAKLDINNTGTRTDICPLYTKWIGCAFDNNDVLHAIDSNGEMYAVDLTTGDTQYEGSTGIYCEGSLGMVYDPESGKYYVTVNNGWQGSLQVIDPQAGYYAQSLYDFTNADQITGLFLKGEIVDPEAPAAPVSFTIDYTPGDMFAKATVVAPTTRHDGQPGEGLLSLSIYANGEYLWGGQCNYGDTYDCDLYMGNLPTGPTKFTAWFETMNVQRGESASLDLFVGFDTPVKPQPTLTLEGNTATVAWPAITRGIYDQELTNVTYTVTRILNGEQTIVAEGLAENQFAETITPNEAGLTHLSYKVSATSQGGTSETATTNTVSCGAVAVPFTWDFSYAEQLTDFTVINVNGDYNTWLYSAPDQCVYVRYNSQVDMDDWLITPAITLQAGHSYEVSFDAKNSTSGDDEKVEAFFGRTPTVEGMTVSGVPVTTLSSRQWETFSFQIDATEDGPYYIGIHGCSYRNRTNLYVDNISIKENASVGITNSNAQRTNAEIYTLDGKRASNAHKPGIYVMKNGEKTTKVVVR